MDETTANTGTQATDSKQLTDEQLAKDYPAVLPLVQQLESIAQRDPSDNVAGMARALATYFRTGE
jgi:hypothetical protein